MGNITQLGKMIIAFVCCGWLFMGCTPDFVPETPIDGTWITQTEVEDSGGVQVTTTVTFDQTWFYISKAYEDEGKPTCTLEFDGTMGISEELESTYGQLNYQDILDYPGCSPSSYQVRLRIHQVSANGENLTGSFAIQDECSIFQQTMPEPDIETGATDWVEDSWYILASIFTDEATGFTYLRITDMTLKTLNEPYPISLDRDNSDLYNTAN